METSKYHADNPHITVTPIPQLLTFESKLQTWWVFTLNIMVCK